MKTLKKFIAATAAAGLVSLQATLPAFATTTINVSNNGAYAISTVTVDNSQTSTVDQYNEADVQNTVDVTANTGNNEASYNTGGSDDINTGNVTTKSEIDNDIGINTANIGCDCLNDATITIDHNGASASQAGTVSTVTLNNTNTYTLNQSNYSTVDNDVTVDGNSGGNDLNYNTGGTGDTFKVTTGSVTADSDLDNWINDNYASLGNSNGTGQVSVTLDYNGAYSINVATIDLTNDVTLDQWNEADVDNDIDVTGTSGDNEAQYNTGGDVDINTGVVDVGSLVDNDINFNTANTDCCLVDLIGNINNNGSYSTSTIDYDDTNDVDAEQSNYCGTGETLDGECDTDVLVDGVSGDNDENYNTNGDVSTSTGNATSDSVINNEINENFLNPTP